jgi:hypothetical protein
MSNTPDWRPLVAALGSRDARTVFARIVLRTEPDRILDGLNPAKGRRALEVLTSSGLVTAENGVLTVDENIFAAVLKAQPVRPNQTGIERFFDDEGRIDRYPANHDERVELLGIVAAQVLAIGEVVGEAEITERLGRYTDDPALLRRQLVDHELLERTRSGSEYARAVTAEG